MIAFLFVNPKSDMRWLANDFFIDMVATEEKKMKDQGIPLKEERNGKSKKNGNGN